MNDTKEVWRVRSGFDHDRQVEDGPQVYDAETDSLVWQGRHPFVAECDRGRGYNVTVIGWQVTTWHHGPALDGEPHLWREPYRLTIERVVLERPQASANDGDGWELLAAAGQSSLERVLERRVRDLSMADPTMFAEPRSMPTPGATGHPPQFYARWVTWYLDAVERHGQRFMARLLAEHPGYSENGVRRILKRAEELGLIADRRPGKAGGTATEKCLSIMKNSIGD